MCNFLVIFGTLRFTKDVLLQRILDEMISLHKVYSSEYDYFNFMQGSQTLTSAFPYHTYMNYPPYRT